MQYDNGKECPEKQNKDTKQDIHTIDQSEVLSEYQRSVVMKNAMWLIIFTVLILFLISGVQLAMFIFSEIDEKSETEEDLISTSEFHRNTFQRQLQNFKFYLDSYRQIMELNISEESTPQQCNQRLFQCKYSNFSDYMHQVQARSLLLEPLNTYFNNINTTTFLVSLTQPLKLVHKMQPGSYFDEDLINKMVQNIPKQIDYEQKKVCFYVVNQILDKAKNSYSVALCNKIDVIICKAGYFQFPLQTIIRQHAQTSQTQILFLDNLLVELVVSSNQHSIIGDIEFVSCLKKTQDVFNFAVEKVVFCNQPSIGNYFKPMVSFINETTSLDEQYYLQTQESISLNKIYLKMYTFPVQNVLGQKSVRANKIICKLQLTIKACIFIIFVWICLMPSTYKSVLKKDLVCCLENMLKMGSTIKSISTMQNNESRVQKFDKFYQQYAKSLPIFDSTIQIFRHLIWYKNLTFTKITRKEKQYLDEGLALFSSSEYAQILAYIYKRKIQILQREIKYLKKLTRVNKQRHSIENDISLKFHSRDLNLKKMDNNSDFKSLENNKSKANEYNQEEKEESLLFSEKILEDMINRQMISLSQNKNKKGVRFSNENLFLELDEKPNLRASRFMLSIPSQSKIQKTSQKSIEESINKVQQEQQLSEVNLSEKTLSFLKEQIQNQIAKQPYVNMKFHEDDGYEESSENEQQAINIKKIGSNKLNKKLLFAYQKLISYFNSIIVIKQIHLNDVPIWQNQDGYRELYDLYTQKIKYTYKFFKFRNKIKERKKKILSKQLIRVKRQRRPLRNLKSYKENFVGSENHIISKMSLLEDQFISETQKIDTSFHEFALLEEKSKIDISMMERACLYQVKLLKILNYPIPYKQLESLCESANSIEVRIEAQHLMASQFNKISPYADLQILVREVHLLESNETTHTQKRKILKLIYKVLQEKKYLYQQSQQIRYIRNYYNYDHKKFYFIADFSDTFDFFRPFLKAIFNGMKKADIYQLYNLAMNQCLEDMVTCQNQVKPFKFYEFEEKFQLLHNQTTKIRSLGSTKVQGRKIVYEKDFSHILERISSQNCSAAQYIVMLLGGESESQSRTHQQYQSTCAYNRKSYQQLHKKIISNMQKNYFHVTLVGFNLKDYQTKQGKLKKYAKHTYNLLQIDLSKPNHEKIYEEINQYLQND